MIATNAQPEETSSVTRDLKTLASFIEFYCKHRHDVVDRQVAAIHGFDVEQIAGHSVALCPDCSKLLAHALVKRSACPMDPKPACKHCPNHCYHPKYREQIQEVMKYSGRWLVMRGRIDYLLHLLF